MSSCRLTILAALSLFAFSSLFAQSVDVKIADETVKITPMGRFYFDGATYIEDGTDLSNGVAMSDVRLGLKAKYKSFDMKVDLGFAGGKVGYKDIFLQYNLNKTSYVKVAILPNHLVSIIWKVLLTSSLLQPMLHRLLSLREENSELSISVGINMHG